MLECCTAGRSAAPLAGVLHRWPECCTAGCCLSSLLRCLRWALFVKYLVEVVLFSSIGAVGGEREERGVLSWTGGGARGAFMSGRKSEGCVYVAGRARGAFMFWQQEHLVTLSVDS